MKETERLVQWNMGDRRALDIKNFVRQERRTEEQNASRNETLLDMLKEKKLLGRYVQVIIMATLFILWHP